MNKKIEFYFKKITDVMDDVSSSVLNSSEKDNVETVKNLFSEIFNEFINPVIQVHNELEGAELAREYILGLGGINKQVLGETKASMLQDWLDGKYTIPENVDQEDDEDNDYESDPTLIC